MCKSNSKVQYFLHFGWHSLRLWQNQPLYCCQMFSPSGSGLSTLTNYTNMWSDFLTEVRTKLANGIVRTYNGTTYIGVPHIKYGSLSEHHAVRTSQRIVKNGKLFFYIEKDGVQSESENVWNNLNLIRNPPGQWSWTRFQANCVPDPDPSIIKQK